MANIYKGFSTIGKVRAPFTLIDGELIKADLLNELKSRKGERVMRPNFGTTVYDILMNPLDEFVIEEIRDEVQRVIEKDPRVEIDEIFTQKVLNENLSKISYTKGLISENERIIFKGDIVEGEKLITLNSVKSEFESQVWSKSNYNWIVSKNI